MICHFHARAISRRRKAWFHIRLSRALFAVKSLDDIEYEQTIICRQLFAGHMVGCRQWKGRKIFHRIVKSVMPGSIATTASFRQWKLVIPQRAKMYWTYGTVSFDLCTSHISLFRSLPLPFLLLLFFFLYREKNMYTRGAEVKKLIDRAGNKLE